MNDSDTVDTLFRKAVSAIDAGDVPALERLLAAHPALVRDRLVSAGSWLRDKIGNDLDGFFKDPWLLWFVAEDPVRNGKLPANVAAVARTIIRVAQRENVPTLQEQLDYALRLVCWSWIARESGVQIELIDALVDAGASLDGPGVHEGRFGMHTDSAIYNGNFGAAEHLLRRGAAVTLSTALCLERWSDVDRLARTSTLDEKQDAFVLAAKHGRTEALRRMLALGVPATTISAQNGAHATALHHAVWSSSPDAVKVLVEAGADLNRPDTVYHATPLGWAVHGAQEEKDESRAKRYRDIATYLRENGGR